MHWNIWHDIKRLKILRSPLLKSRCSKIERIGASENFGILEDHDFTSSQLSRYWASEQETANSQLAFVTFTRYKSDKALLSKCKMQNTWRKIARDVQRKREKGDTGDAKQSKREYSLQIRRKHRLLHPIVQLRRVSRITSCAKCKLNLHLRYEKRKKLRGISNARTRREKRVQRAKISFDCTRGTIMQVPDYVLCNQLRGKLQ